MRVIGIIAFCALVLACGHARADNLALNLLADGQGAHVRGPFPAPGPGSSVTFAFWLKLEVNSYGGKLMYLWGGDEGYSWDLAIYVNHGGELGVYAEDTYHDLRSDSVFQAVPNGQWTHIVVVIDTVEYPTITVYKDGDMKNQVVQQPSPYFLPRRSGEHPVAHDDKAMASRRDGSTPYYELMIIGAGDPPREEPEGKRRSRMYRWPPALFSIDELKVWDRALTPSEVAPAMSTVGPLAGLHSYFKFDGDGTTMASDVGSAVGELFVEEWHRKSSKSKDLGDAVGIGYEPAAPQRSVVDCTIGGNPRHPDCGQCGDGIVDVGAGEQCDPPSAAEGCSTQCQRTDNGVLQFTSAGQSASIPGPIPAPVFDDEKYEMINEATYAFWIKLEGGLSCYHGNGYSEEGPYYYYYGESILSFWRDRGFPLIIEVDCEKDLMINEMFFHRLPVSRWTHITVVHAKDHMTVYKNGEASSSMQFPFDFFGPRSQGRADEQASGVTFVRDGEPEVEEMDPFFDDVIIGDFRTFHEFPGEECGCLARRSGSKRRGGFRYDSVALFAFDELKIWDRALDASELLAAMSSTGPSEGLISYFKFDGEGLDVVSATGTPVGGELVYSPRDIRNCPDPVAECDWTWYDGCFGFSERRSIPEMMDCCMGFFHHCNVGGWAKVPTEELLYEVEFGQQATTAMRAVADCSFAGGNPRHPSCPSSAVASENKVLQLTAPGAMAYIPGPLPKPHCESGCGKKNRRPESRVGASYAFWVKVEGGSPGPLLDFFAYRSCEVREGRRERGRRGRGKRGRRRCTPSEELRFVWNGEGLAVGPRGAKFHLIPISKWTHFTITIDPDREYPGGVTVYKDGDVATKMYVPELPDGFAEKLRSPFFDEVAIGTFPHLRFFGRGDRREGDDDGEDDGSRMLYPWMFYRGPIFALDELKMWNRVLAPGEVASAMSTAGPQSGLFAAFSFDDAGSELASSTGTPSGEMGNFYDMLCWFGPLDMPIFGCDDPPFSEGEILDDDFVREITQSGMLVGGLSGIEDFERIQDDEDGAAHRRMLQDDDGDDFFELPSFGSADCGVTGMPAHPACLAKSCDLARTCGGLFDSECPVRQSTFYKWNDPPALFAVDASPSTCLRTADASADPNPQWLSVDLGAEHLIGTVRFASAGAASAFEVVVSATDAAPSAALNPTVGSALPALTEACAVAAGAASGVLEAECPLATKGRFVFIRRTAPSEELEVCDVAVFDHVCAAPGAEVSCGLGYEPVTCSDCGGCRPCPSGTYSDKAGPYQCTPCPGLPRPYSPEGSTSMFQCEGDAYLDGTSTLAVDGVSFNQQKDAWEIMVQYAVAPRVLVNGMSTIYISKGGDASPRNDGSFQASNFPCRADTSKEAGDDLSVSLSETMCCLQDMRDDYVMTTVFRDWTDDLNLVAANDVCDAEKGSDLIVNADLEVIEAEGTVFVDSEGKPFANEIRADPVSKDWDVHTVKITIPDAELYKISRHWGDSRPEDEGDYLTDSREIFIGLLDLLPTGTRVVDSAAQQVKVVLTRTQYGSFAAYGEQNIDYDFISYLNGRVHQVAYAEEELRRDAGFVHYAEITYVYDDRLQPVNAGPVLMLDEDDEDGVYLGVSLQDDEFSPCAGPSDSDFVKAVKQGCGPKALEWEEAACPQVSLPEDHFGRLYIPLPANDPPSEFGGSVQIAFSLFMVDAAGRNATLRVSMDLAVARFVSWCEEEAGLVDLAERVSPSLLIGSSSEAPPRTFDGTPADVAALDEFASGAETLQDGLITLMLELNETLAENLEVFLEDVLVVHINPGSSPSLDDILTDHSSGSLRPDYRPSYKYDPDTRDAWMVIPEGLKADCPAEDASESFFGCVHKHIVRDKVVTNATDAYLVGSALPPEEDGAQDFVATVLGSGTASVAARELGRDYEEFLVEEHDLVVDGKANPSKVALWINPGHRWGQTVHHSEYSLSQNVVIYVLFGVNSGVGETRRMLLQATQSSTSQLAGVVKYNVNAASLLEAVLDNVKTVEITASVPLDAEEACLPEAQLRAALKTRLAGLLTPHATGLQDVQLVQVTVQGADCDGSQRRAGSTPTATMEAVVVLEDTEEASLDVAAAAASGGLLSISQVYRQKDIGGTPGLPTSDADEPAKEEEEEEESGSSNTVVIGAAAGAAVGVVLLALLAFKMKKGCGGEGQPLTEVVSSGVVASHGSGNFGKEQVESVIFGMEAGSLKPAAVTLDDLAGDGASAPPAASRPAPSRAVTLDDLAN